MPPDYTDPRQTYGRPFTTVNGAALQQRFLGVPVTGELLTAQHPTPATCHNRTLVFLEANVQHVPVFPGDPDAVAQMQWRGPGGAVR